jgi:hypothetical protein
LISCASANFLLTDKIIPHRAKGAIIPKLNTIGNRISCRLRQGNNNKKGHNNKALYQMCHLLFVEQSYDR